ncbi:histone acetyltransferase 1 [Rhizophlyctis rosea]|nr:histone acetyltransferase 1 [Rhizophlyctis rosea]
MTTGSLLGPRKDGAWTVSSNDALELKLVRTNGDDLEGEEFHPEFTYPVFGDEETIIGYQDLKIQLHYAAGSLATYLGIDYSAKSTGSPKPQDVVKILADFMAPDNYDAFLATVRRDETEFRPMGEKFHEYELENRDGSEEGGVVYEMYKCTFATPKCKEYHKRVQLFLLWFIEGASFIEDTDENWELIFLYEKRNRSGQDVYSLVGYMTYYPFFYYPDKKRMRISQFLILPTYQQKGHGSTLYRTIYNHFKMRDDVAEVTGEVLSDDLAPSGSD